MGLQATWYTESTWSLQCCSRPVDGTPRDDGCLDPGLPPALAVNDTAAGDSVGGPPAFPPAAAPGLGLLAPAAGAALAGLAALVRVCVAAARLRCHSEQVSSEEQESSRLSYVGCTSMRHTQWSCAVMSSSGADAAPTLHQGRAGAAQVLALVDGHTFEQQALLRQAAAHRKSQTRMRPSSPQESRQSGRWLVNAKHRMGSACALWMMRCLARWRRSQTCGAQQAKQHCA